MKIRKRKKGKKDLSPKRQTFIKEYLLDFNAARAARAAGYSNTNGLARVKGYHLLQQDEIQEALQKEMEKKAKRIKITEEKVLADIEQQRRGAIKDRQYTAAMKGSELHGRHLLMFGDKVLHGITPEMIELAKNLPEKMELAKIEVVGLLKQLAERGEAEEITVGQEIKRKFLKIRMRRKKGQQKLLKDDTQGVIYKNIQPAHPSHIRQSKELDIERYINDPTYDPNEPENENDPLDKYRTNPDKKAISNPNWKPF